MDPIEKKRTEDEKEFMGILRQLSPENKQKVLRLLVHMTTPDGFSEAYATFVSQHGGPKKVSLDDTDRFMDEWEANHND